jgi:predicted transcriptional regulator/gas vesicle protein
MDLKTILATTNEAKKKRSINARKPVEIADEDRPYSLENTSELQQQVSNQPRSTFLQANEVVIQHKPILNSDPILFPKIKRKKTENKLATNWQQNSNKVATNWQQTGNNLEEKDKNWQQTGNRTSNTICNKLATNWQQTGNKLATKIAFSELVGLQRDIIIFICHECKNSRSKITESLTLEHIAKSLKRNIGAVRTTIQRLEKKGCLERVEFKNGRGGWSRYEIKESIYHDALRNETGNKLATNWQQTGNKLATELATELATSSSSSSSYLINKTTTEIPSEWHFDITAYRNFGFTISQIKQLASLGVISATDVEKSLIEFNYDVENGTLPPIKTNKINFLMGLLRGGHTYVSETYRNEQEATIFEMARRAEDKRKSLLEAKFMAWEANIGEAEKKEIENKIPVSLTILYRTHGSSNVEVKNWLIGYFLKKGYT